MSPRPHKNRGLKYPPTESARNTPVRLAKRFYVKANRLYARASNLVIRKADLPSQAQLNNREMQLQAYLGSKRVNRGNGSPIHGNPQQVFTFSATDETPINTVLDDAIDFADPLPVDEHDVEFVMIPSVAPRTESPYQRMVEISQRVTVQSLLGSPSDADMTTMMRIERSVQAQGF